MEWRNRIVSYGLVDPQQLAANPNNWRIHPTAQKKALRSILDEIGWVGVVLINVRTNNLVDGHLRVEEAIAKGEKQIPALYIDLSENEELLVLTMLDPIGAMAGTDKEILDENLRETNTTSADVSQFLADLATDKKLYTLPPKDAEPPEDGGKDKGPAEPRRCPHCGEIL